MSLAVKIIGVIIMAFGTLAVMGTAYTASSEAMTLSLSEALSPDRFWSYMTKYIGQSLVIVIGFAVYVIGIKLEHRS